MSNPLGYIFLNKNYNYISFSSFLKINYLKFLTELLRLQNTGSLCTSPESFDDCKGTTCTIQVSKI